MKKFMKILQIIFIPIDSFPKFYHYFTETNETKSVLVIERFGRTLKDLWKEFRPFSSINVMKIGLQIVSMIGKRTQNGFQLTKQFFVVGCIGMDA